MIYEKGVDKIMNEIKAIKGRAQSNETKSEDRHAL